MCGIAVVFGYIEMDTAKYTTYIFYVSQLRVLATSAAYKSGGGGHTHIKVYLTKVLLDVWQPCGPPSPYTMGNGSFPGIKLPGRDVDRPPPSSAEFKERVELYISSPSGPSLPVIG